MARRSGGVSLIAVETVRALIEFGGLIQSADARVHPGFATLAPMSVGSAMIG
jgi:hypothetical protein